VSDTNTSPEATMNTTTSQYHLVTQPRSVDRLGRPSVMVTAYAVAGTERIELGCFGNRSLAERAFARWTRGNR